MFASGSVKHFSEPILLFRAAEGDSKMCEIRDGSAELWFEKPYAYALVLVVTLPLDLVSTLRDPKFLIISRNSNAFFGQTGF